MPGPDYPKNIQSLKSHACSKGLIPLFEPKKIQRFLAFFGSKNGVSLAFLNFVYSWDSLISCSRRMLLVHNLLQENVKQVQLKNRPIE